MTGALIASTMTSVFRVRTGLTRTLVALLLTLALPAQWEASCTGWQSAREAMACCQQMSHDETPSAASGCCAAQEGTRHAHSPVPAVLAIYLVPAALPVPALVPAPFPRESTHRAHPVDPRLLASLFLI